MFAMEFVQHFLIDSHSSGDEESHRKQGNATHPPKEHRKSSRVFLCQIGISCTLLKVFKNIPFENHHFLNRKDDQYFSSHSWCIRRNKGLKAFFRWIFVREWLISPVHSKVYNWLTTLLPEIIVQITMPAVIISTDKYFENSYRFRKIIMPITMFAINEPCKMNERRRLGQKWFYWTLNHIFHEKLMHWLE